MSRDSRYIHPHWHLEAPSLCIGVAQPSTRNSASELAVDFDDPVAFRPESADLPAAFGLGRTCETHRGAERSRGGSAVDIAGSSLFEVPVGSIPGASTLHVVWGERFGLPSTLE